MAPSRRLVVFPLAALLATAAGAQDVHLPRSSQMHWSNLRLVMAPDSAGFYLWANSGDAGKPQRVYSAVFDPAAVATWISDARWFLDQKVTRADTALTRSSPALIDVESLGRIYLLRRRSVNDWTSERYLIMEPASSRNEPVIISAEERIVREILDSVEMIGRRTPPITPAVLRDSSGAEVKFDAPASLKPGNKPPAYPGGARMQNREAVVIVRFVVGVDGRADMSTVHVVAAPGESFQKAVLETLPKLRFEPARLRGTPVRQLVSMPFDFALIR